MPGMMEAGGALPDHKTGLPGQAEFNSPLIDFVVRGKKVT